MQTEYLIAVDEFCANNKVENSFINLLERNGLIEIITIQDAGFLDAGQIQQIEKYVHFYYELDINLEGIEAITHLLHRIDTMHDEIVTLRNRLRLYETEL